MIFDILVIGAGHAGLEAALICAKKKYKVAIFVLDKKLIGNLPCNPSIGGPAKGIVTREIDALGGFQAKAADYAQLQMKILNTSKGAGTWALRAQVDKVKYHQYALKTLEESKYITIVEKEVYDLLINNNSCDGVITKDGEIYKSKKTIITSGTFLNSKVHIGNTLKDEGPDGFKNSKVISKSLQNNNLKMIRLKTGTPPRILKESIDFNKLSLELGTNKKLSFSHFESTYLSFEKQQPCYLVYTNSKTHSVIMDNLKNSPMYNGQIVGVGPRYCPSIEDKVVRFSDKERHQIFVEPESLELDTMYLSGFSTSMPVEVQEQMIRSLDGFENAVIKKYAYAIEYDAIESLQLYPTLEFKDIKNLFSAGQINGTSGYEEAACQGLMAGINCICQLENREDFILGRDEAYIGVLIDDLTTKKITEPYRLLTSRAEYRLELRNDNADERLIKKGYDLGLISESNYQSYLTNISNLNLAIKKLKDTKISSINDLDFNFKKIDISLYELLKKQNFYYEDVEKYLDLPFSFEDRWKEKINIRIKYEGYILAQKKTINERSKFSKINLKDIKDYKLVPNISLEAVDKLNIVKPLSLDQASRISGINLNDLINIKFYIEKNKL
ncbi:MAG: tRNA uridine-5-carboxymethylaminomethyl(34) synthesis enzyme MnmG [Malacoplasma sp.]